MRGGGNVENRQGHGVAWQVEHGADEHAGVQRDGLAGFEIDFQFIFRAKILHDAHEAVEVVTGARDMVAAAEVDPFEFWKILAEFFLEGGDGVFERVAVLLAEGVKMQAVETGEVARLKFGTRRAEARAGRAGIV